MNASKCFAALVICTIWFTTESEAHAQLRGRRIPHFSRTATVSPYVNLFQSRNGGVNNYLTEVRPRLQFQRQLNNLQTANRNLPFQGSNLNQQTTVLQDTIEQTIQMSLRQGRRSQPATAGRFMNTGNYYPNRSISIR